MNGSLCICGMLGLQHHVLAKEREDNNIYHQDYQQSRSRKEKARTKCVRNTVV